MQLIKLAHLSGLPACGSKGAAAHALRIAFLLLTLSNMSWSSKSFSAKVTLALQEMLASSSAVTRLFTACKVCMYV